MVFDGQGDELVIYSSMNRKGHCNEGGITDSQANLILCRAITADADKLAPAEILDPKSYPFTGFERVSIALARYAASCSIGPMGLPFNP